jgi:hypothetical protein
MSNNVIDNYYVLPIGYLVYQSTLFCVTNRLLSVPVNIIVLPIGYLVYQSTLFCVTNRLLSVPVNIIMCYKWVT